MTLTSRRQPPPINPDSIATQSWIGARTDITRLFKWLKNNWSGIPGGFAGSAPATVTVGGAADSGNEDASWMAADAQLVIAAGTPQGLANSNVSGSASTALRGDAQFKRDVRVKENGTDVGTRNALNFKSGFVVSDDSVNDRVNVQVASAVAGRSRSANPDASDYVLHRATHMESYIVAIHTGKI